ncbi:MAG: hypothetical protein LIO79_10390 [Rikenellaceae bacterium]|nr:hypothetical protein [Rikenellaceae bacterium]
MDIYLEVISILVISGLIVGFLKWFLAGFILSTITNLSGTISISDAVQNLFRV